jgi:hypothetical protein
VQCAENFSFKGYKLLIAQDFTNPMPSCALRLQDSLYSVWETAYANVGKENIAGSGPIEERFFGGSRSGKKGHQSSNQPSRAEERIK